MASKWGLKEKLNDLQRMKVTLPVKLGNEAKNHFLQSFRNQGFTDRGFQAWKPRRTGKDGRAILVKTGNLRRSIKVGSARWERVAIGSYSIDYAKVHNYGLKAGRGKGFKMPKRQFIGDSEVLKRRLRAIVEKDFGRLIK